MVSHSGERAATPGLVYRHCCYPGGRDERTAPQRLADAFVEAFRRVSLDGGLPTGGGDRPRALISIGLDQLRQGVGCGLMIDTGDQLSVSAMRRLAATPRSSQSCSAAPGRFSMSAGLAHLRRTHPGRRDHQRPGLCPPRLHSPAPLVWGHACSDVDDRTFGPASLWRCSPLCGFHHRLYDAGTWTITFASDSIPEAVPPAWVAPRRRPRRHERFLE